METELKRLFELRKQESDVITFNSDAYGRMSLLLAQTFRHKDQPRVLDAIAQRVDDVREDLAKIAEGYRQICLTTSKDDIKQAARNLENSTNQYIGYLESSLA